MIRLAIKEILKEKNITQKELAEMSGLDESQISRLSANRLGSINREQVTRVIKALEITDLNDIFKV